MLPPFVESKPVIERELFAGDNLPPRNNPDTPTAVIGAAVRSARVVDQSSDIAPRTAIQIVPGIEFKNIDTIISAPSPAGQAQRFTPLRLHLRNTFARIFDHERTIGNSFTSIDTAAVDGRSPVLNPARNGCALASSVA